MPFLTSIQLETQILEADVALVFNFIIEEIYGCEKIGLLALKASFQPAPLYLLDNVMITTIIPHRNVFTFPFFTLFFLFSLFSLYPPSPSTTSLRPRSPIYLNFFNHSSLLSCLIRTILISTREAPLNMPSIRGRIFGRPTLAKCLRSILVRVPLTSSLLCGD